MADTGHVPPCRARGCARMVSGLILQGQPSNLLDNRLGSM